MMQVIDSHAHVFGKYYKDDLEDIIEECRLQLKYVVNVACDRDMIEESVARSYPENFYKLFGFHPHDASKISSEDLRWLEQKIVEDDTVIGIGETGLDYFKEYSPIQDQKRLFKSQILLSKKLQKPLVVHCRDAHTDTIGLLKQARLDGFKENILMHCFSGSVEEVNKYVELDVYFSVAGPVTFKNNKSAPEVIKAIPPQRLLVETDCPYLTPVPYRGKRNKPVYVYYVLSRISDILDISQEKLNSLIEVNFNSFLNQAIV